MGGGIGACRNLFENNRVFIKESVELRTRYALYFEELPTQDELVFYESMSGARMMDSPYAIFQFLLDDPRFDQLIHVWSVAKYETIPDRYRSHPRMRFVTRHTDAYLRALASSKYVICNSALPDYFVRKPDQQYLNTWHGIAYKRIGRSDSAPLGGAAGVYNMMQATHVLTPCRFMTDMQLHGMSMSGIYSGELGEVGYPRMDSTFAGMNGKSACLATDLGLSAGKKTLLYAPTWRGTSAEGKFDVERLVRDLRALSELGANVLFMGHHIMMRHLRGVNFDSVSMPPPSTNTNELLAQVDVLITDYSSIFFDFLVTGRPIIHYMYDYDDYVSERGLNLDIPELPGDIAHTSDDLIGLATHHLKNPYVPSAGYRHARERFCPHDDGYASARTVNWFFLGDRHGANIVPKDMRRSVVYWAGTLGSIEDSANFLSNARSVALSGEANVAVVVARSVQRSPDLMGLIRSLGPTISIVARNGHGMVASEEELMAIDQVEKSGSSSVEARALYRRAYVREYRRILGDAVFDEHIEFKANNRFWKELARCFLDGQ